MHDKHFSPTNEIWDSVYFEYISVHPQKFIEIWEFQKVIEIWVFQKIIIEVWVFR